MYLGLFFLYNSLMNKIVITQDLNLQPDQVGRLKALGELTMYADLPATYDDWLVRVKDADIICSGKFGLEQKGHELKNKFISLPFVSVSWYDSKKGKADNLTIANAPGSNKDAVSDWAIAMLINLTRDLPAQINQQPYTEGEMQSLRPGLTGMKVCILGAGNIGKRIARICEALDMKVSYYERGDSLEQKSAGQDIIINCLALNSTTRNLLDDAFFKNLKKDTYYISVAINEICDVEAMLAALDGGTLAGVATDCATIQVGNAYDPYFVRLSKHPKVLATPHIAFNTTVSARVGVDIMIDNIEAWLAGSPINLVG
jgi:phosphoglycerate dehydrogenase-like enzyme